MVPFCKSFTCLVGKTAIVTGSNTGLGYETALDLAKRGCRVILACRNLEKASKARKKIIAATGNENVIIKCVNLESLTSVREFAKGINDTEERLDILINNAGAVFLPNQITRDGLQLEMVVNYFSSFLLTILLLDLLKKSAPSRIVNVSSSFACFVQNLNLEKINDFEWGGLYLYGKTKLCQILFTQELAKRLTGTQVTAYSVHPGAAATDIQSFSSTISWFATKLLRSAREGAQTIIYVAVENGIEKYSGEHFVDCKRVGPYYNATEKAKAKKLWRKSEEMVGIKHLK